MTVAEQKTAFAGLSALREEYLCYYGGRLGAMISQSAPRSAQQIRKELPKSTQKGIAIRYRAQSLSQYWRSVEAAASEK